MCVCVCVACVFLFTYSCKDDYYDGLICLCVCVSLCMCVCVCVCVCFTHLHQALDLCLEAEKDESRPVYHEPLKEKVCNLLSSVNC